MVLFIYACLELRIELNTPWVVNKCHKRVGRGRKGRRGKGMDGAKKEKRE